VIQLREFRVKSGLSQEEAAIELGIERTSLSKMENGKQNIDPVLLFKMAKLYNSLPEKLLGIEEKKDFSLSFRDGSNIDAESKKVLEKIEKVVRSIILLEGEERHENS